MRRPMPCGGTGVSEAARDPDGMHASAARPSRPVKCARRAMSVMLVLRRDVSLEGLPSALDDSLQALQPGLVDAVVEVRQRFVILPGRRRIHVVVQALEACAPLDDARPA